jgi:hypothetical protein
MVDYSIAFVALTMFASVVSAQAPDAPQVHVDSLEIINDGPNSVTTISVSVALPQKSIVGIDDQASKVTKFTDDKGTDLTDGPFPNVWHLFLPGQVRDGKAIGLKFMANRKPAKGATKIRIKGEITLLYGSEVKNLKVNDVHFAKPNATVPVGPFALTWHKPLNPKNEEKQLPQLVLSVKEQSKEVAIVYASVTGTGPPPENAMVLLDRLSLGATYLPQTAAYFRVGTAIGPPFTLQVFYYDKLSRLTVPVDVEFGLSI